MSVHRNLEDGGEVRAGGLTHVDARGRASMVDVTAKPATERRAEARCRIVGIVNAGELVARDGEVLTEARVAGLRAAKGTSELIPLCHPLLLSGLTVDFLIGDDIVEVRATAETIGQTGVEMEALTAAAVAGLSVLGRVRPKHPSASIDDIELLEKRGGRSGTWLREPVGGVD